jgi:hypothetical protein
MNRDSVRLPNVRVITRLDWLQGLYSKICRAKVFPYFTVIDDCSGCLSDFRRDETQRVAVFQDF